jgi:hypothetical protein
MRHLALLLLTSIVFNTAHCAQMPVATQYVLHCSGCHGLEGHGLASNGIPDLSEAWRYANTSAGRKYLISVPGVAASRLNNHDAAAMLPTHRAGACSSWGSEKEKAFFSEEKNQKTFMSSPLPRSRPWPGSIRERQR